MSETAKVISTDVLVMGGGIAGLCAANKAADQGANVLMSDKAVVPWTGQMPNAGGGFTCIPPETVGGVEADIQFKVKEGEYLNDQEVLSATVSDTYPFMSEMFEWGVPFKTNTNGEMAIEDGGGMVNCNNSPMFLPTLLGRAVKKGVKVLNRVFMVDLLQEGGRIVGAVGLDTRTGDFYVVKSKATIIAVGGCNYKARRLFHTNCGEGVAMAYHAGAELRNAEFCNTFMVSTRMTQSEDRAARRVIGAFENALGEIMVKKYPEMNPLLDPSTPRWRRGLIFNRWIRVFYEEMKAGRGPIYLNLAGHPEMITGYGDGTSISERTHGYVNMMKKLRIDVVKEKVEWVPVPEFHGGPIRVGVNSETTLAGLYATGDASQNGSAYLGALPGCGLAGGVALGFATTTGFRAGIAAGKSIASLPQPKIRDAEVDRLKKEIVAPLAVKEGYNPYDAIKDIQTVVFRLHNSYFKRKDRLEKALGEIEEIEAKLPNLMAKDPHELVRCHEAKAMAINAELLFKASLMRTETRGANIREDYPERDDRNWLKWIIIRKEGKEAKFWTEPVPIEKYKYKPE